MTLCRLCRPCQRDAVTYLSRFAADSVHAALCKRAGGVSPHKGRDPSSVTISSASHHGREDRSLVCLAHCPSDRHVTKNSLGHHSDGAASLADCFCRPNVAGRGHLRAAEMFASFHHIFLSLWLRPKPTRSRPCRVPCQGFQFEVSTFHPPFDLYAVNNSCRRAFHLTGSDGKFSSASAFI